MLLHRMNNRSYIYPFAGGVKKPAVTNKHRSLIWENMLGTVIAWSQQPLS
jgi:hypothetical protein